MQPAALLALQEMGPQILEEVRAEAPHVSGVLKESLSLDSVKPYGAYRVQLTISSTSPYFEITVRGIQDSMTVGQPGKVYASKAREIYFVGQWTWKARSGNNFPRRAIRANLPGWVGLYRKNFVVRLKGPE